MFRPARMNNAGNGVGAVLSALMLAASLLIASPVRATSITALDCVDLARPDITITYVIDEATGLAQIKTQRFKPEYNAFYAAIVPVDVTKENFVIHTQSFDRRPYNDIVISRVTGAGTVSTMPDVNLKCGPSAHEQVFSQPILIPDKTGVISVTCANLLPEQGATNAKSIDPPNLIIDTKSAKVFSFVAGQSPLLYGRIVDQGRDFIRFCIPHDCRDADGEEAGVLNVVNGAYVLLRRSGGRLSYAGADRAVCKASVT